MNHKVQKIKEQVLRKIPAILSHLDRDPYSKTRGSFDRLYWGWKLKDYPDATLQRLIYPLANYYCNVDDSFCDEERFVFWITSAFEYLKTIQHRDGSQCASWSCS